MLIIILSSTQELSPVLRKLLVTMTIIKSVRLCLNLTMTPVWLWHDSIHQWTPISCLHFERQMNSMKLRISLKWRRTPFPFLDAKTWIKLTLRLHVFELDEMKRFIYIAFLLWTIFWNNIFFIIGKLMNAHERVLKLKM